jgi:PAS domain S-box-containing protein
MEGSGAVARIKTLLRLHPKGLTISQIASQLKINRNSISKYLEILQVSGQVENRIIGQAKIYYIARRIPVSALLNLSSALVCTLDEDQRILYANKKFLDFFGLKGEEVMGRNPEEILRQIAVQTEAMSKIFSHIDTGEESEREVILHTPEEFYFRIKGIPTVFEDGSHGTTLLLEDRTRERQYVRNLEFLARTSAELADIQDDENLFQYIADRLVELVPESLVVVMSINPLVRITTCEALSGDSQMVQGIINNFGNLVGVLFPMDSIPEAVPFLSQSSLQEGAERLYIQAYRMLPEVLCDAVQERLSLGKNYGMGCVCRGGLYGNVSIRLKKGKELQNRETIEAFVRQAGVALQRRHIRERLRVLEDQK